MNETNMSRRDFMQSAAVGASALAVGLSGKAIAANEKVSLAWIGCGGRGKYLLRRALEIEDIRVVAACDLREERANEAADLAGEVNQKINTYLDFQKMLEKEKPDGVVVATEVGNHGKCVIPVLEAGIHCFSEKPMDASIERVDAVVRAARNSKAVYGIAFQRRFDPGYRAVVQAIHDGRIGKVDFMQGHWHWTQYSFINRWVGDIDLSGGRLNEQACHHIDLMSWVMGNAHPTHCMAVGAITRQAKNPPEHRAETQSAVIYTFPSGAIFSYTHLNGIPQPFTGEKSWVMGQNGGMDLCTGEFYPLEGDPVKIADPSWGANSERNELVEFAECCRTGKQPFSNVETGRVSTLTTLMAMKAMYRRNTKTFEPGLITWEEIGSTT